VSRHLGLRAQLALAFSLAVALTLVLFSAAVIVLHESEERREEEARQQGRAEPDDPHEGTWRVMLAMAVALPLVVAGSAGAGALLARRALLPLREAAERAEAARTSPLELTLPLYGRGDEWDGLATALNLLLADARTSVERIRRFTGDAAHELRTPLTALLGEAELALRRERRPEELRASLEIIQEEGQRMARLVEALLTLARAEAGVLLPTPLARVSLDTLCREAVARAWAAAGRRGAPVTELECVGSAGEILGDGMLLLRVLENLLDNALRHGQGAGVELRLGEREGRARIEVRDRGPGVPEALVPRLFGRFMRADEARTGEGVGLGLSLCRAIAEAHGGTLTYEPGHPGATFILEVPRAKGMS
jgi:two-component system heavy metal sensor histidine kinase CusS